MLKARYYETLEDLPIYNWHRLHKDNDLKWLLRQPVRFMTPTTVHKLNVHYRDLNYQFEHLNLTVLKAKRDVIVNIIDLILDISKNSKDIEKIAKASTILQALIITPDPVMDWLFDVKFTETPNQKHLLTGIAVKIERYNKQKEQHQDNPQSLNEKVVQIETLLHVNIDVKTCSVALFAEYERQAVALIRQQQRNGIKRTNKV